MTDENTNLEVPEIQPGTAARHPSQESEANLAGEDVAVSTRKGKIARLPQFIREQVNERLRDGEPGGPLLEWLNGLDAVKEVLAEYFEGAPVTKQNLSEWRQGGFREWEPRWSDAELVQEMREHAELLEGQAEGRDVADWLAPVVSAELAKAAKALMTEELEPEEKWRRLRELLSALVELRRADHRARRLRRQQEDWKREDDDREDEYWAREMEKLKKQALAPFLAKSQQRALSGIYGDSEFGQWAAEYIAALNHDLPLPPAPKLEKSRRVKPSQSKSNQVKVKSKKKSNQNVVSDDATKDNPPAYDGK